MKLILQRYLLKEFFRIYIPALAVLEFTLILGMTLQSLHEGVNVTALADLAPHIFFYSLPTALPVALLAATVITYGRLSGDNELWAMLTNGVHLWIIILPVALLGLLFSFFSLGLNAELLPKSYRMLKTLQERAVHEILAQRLGAAQGKMRFPPYYIYIKSAEGGTFKDIIIMETHGEGVSSLILAEKGRLSVDADYNLILFSLEKGKFIKPDPQRPTDSPTAIAFDETLFKVPLGLSEHTTFKRYASLRELFELKNTVTKEIRASRDVPREKHLGRRAIRGLAQEAKDAYYKVVAEKAEAMSEVEKAQESITRERKQLENTDNEIKVSESYIRVAEEALGDLLLSRELARSAKSQPGDLKAKDTKIEELTQRIKEERMRIEEAERQKGLAEEAIESEKQKSARFVAEVERLKALEISSATEYQRWERIMTLREKIEKRRDLDIAIHRRLSPAFSCLAFVLVGIPIGVMSRRGNILIGFFVSFLVVLVIYYPLITLGKVLAADARTPVIPTMWGPNLVIAAIGVALLIKVLRK
jgi:lipopolysaccharide export LptBFGC system permease protein LptF